MASVPPPLQEGSLCGRSSARNTFTFIVAACSLTPEGRSKFLRREEESSRKAGGGGWGGGEGRVMGGKEESGEEKIDDNERRGKGEEAGKVKEKEGGKTKRERECDFMMGGGEGV